MSSKSNNRHVNRVPYFVNKFIEFNWIPSGCLAKLHIDNFEGGNNNRAGEDSASNSLQKTKTNVTTATATSNSKTDAPTFYVGNGNGCALVETSLTNLGWKRITDKTLDSFKLKWVECKQNINYHSFREGEQLVNHIPNCGLLTNKLGLLQSLQSYDRATTAVKRPTRQSNSSDTLKSYLDFTPLTFRLDSPKEREKFYNSYGKGDIWICKPTGANQGKGIFLVRDLEEFKTNFVEEEKNNNKITKRGGGYKPTTNRIIQKYVANPLLLDGKKFDLRAYMLIANTCPLLVLHRKGYVRLSLSKYDNDTENLGAHLTNQFIQKKEPNYKEEKEDTVWDYERLNEYINTKVAPGRELPIDWVFNTLTKSIKSIMLYLIKCVSHRLASKVGYFDLYGLDFMIDSNMKVWFIEVNVNPALATNCKVLKDVVPDVVDETLKLSIESFEKTRRHMPLLPLKSLNNFQILYHQQPQQQQQQQQQPNGGFPRRARSLSPTKEVSNSVDKVESTLLVRLPQANYNNTKTTVITSSQQQQQRPTLLQQRTILSVPTLRGIPPGMEKSPYALQLLDNANAIRMRFSHGGSNQKTTTTTTTTGAGKSMNSAGNTEEKSLTDSKKKSNNKVVSINNFTSSISKDNKDNKDKDNKDKDNKDNNTTSIDKPENNAVKNHANSPTTPPDNNNLSNNNKVTTSITTKSNINNNNKSEPNSKFVTDSLIPKLGLTNRSRMPTNFNMKPKVLQITKQQNLPTKKINVNVTHGHDLMDDRGN